MTTTTFTDGVTPVVAAWLNDVDAFVYEPLPFADLSTIAGTPTLQEGRVWWDATEKALTSARGTNCSINLGQTQILPPCQNTTGVTIPKGTFLMVTGVAADKLKVEPAVTDGTVDFKWMVGFALDDIIAGATDGCVVTDGTIDNVDTSAWVVGTTLYPDPLVAGGLSSTQPTAPAYKAPVAIVTRQQLNNGRIYVRFTLPSRLGETDSNVQFTGLANNDIVAYDSATGLWKNQSITSLTSSGTYTPTLTAVDNTSAVSVLGSTFRYTRTGNIVHISGSIQGTTTTSGVLSRIMFTLPVASNLTSSYQVAGTGVAEGASANVVASIYGDIASDVGVIAFYAIASATVNTMRFTCSYEIL